jgi:hypothetical protein
VSHLTTTTPPSPIPLYTQSLALFVIQSTHNPHHESRWLLRRVPRLRRATQRGPGPPTTPLSHDAPLQRPPQAAKRRQKYTPRVLPPFAALGQPLCAHFHDALPHERHQRAALDLTPATRARVHAHSADEISRVVDKGENADLAPEEASKQGYGATSDGYKARTHTEETGCQAMGAGCF